MISFVIIDPLRKRNQLLQEGKIRFDQQLRLDLNWEEGLDTRRLNHFPELAGNFLENVEDALTFLKKHLQLRWEITSGSTRRKKLWQADYAYLSEQSERELL